MVWCGATLIGCSDAEGPELATGSALPGGAGAANSSVDEVASFERDVHPILVATCGAVGCHDVATSATPGHGAAEPGDSFSALQGMSRGEPVYRRILARGSGEDPDGFMPPPYAGCEGPLGTGACLSVQEFELLSTWVEQGAMR